MSWKSQCWWQEKCVVLPGCNGWFGVPVSTHLWWRSIKAIDCQISPLKKGKSQVSFTSHRVGTHNLTIVSTSTRKLNIAKIQVIYPLLHEVYRRETYMQILREPWSVAIAKEGQLVVCEKGATVLLCAPLKAWRSTPSAVSAPVVPRRSQSSSCAAWVSHMITIYCNCDWQW